MDRHRCHCSLLLDLGCLGSAGHDPFGFHSLVCRGQLGPAVIPASWGDAFLAFAIGLGLLSVVAMALVASTLVATFIRML